MNKRRIILQQASKLFFQFGIHHITMDDIANSCGISKKTIYISFQNKDDLVSHTLKLEAEKLKDYLKEISAHSKNALEELYHFFEYINSVSTSITPNFNIELKKYHSQNYIELFKYKTHIIMPFVIANIENGKREGYYKSDLNAKDICESFDNIFAMLLNYDYSSNSGTYKNAIIFLNSLFLYRLVSVKGLETLDLFKKN